MLKIGDRVRVTASTEATARTVRKLNGREYVVKSRCGYKNGQCYYELYGAESKEGIPYGFAEDWLKKI